MNRTWIGLVGTIVAVLIVATAAYAFEADFDPSIYNPDVGELVNFEVCESCLGGGGYLYTWDFDGDGTTDMETEDAVITHVFPSEGYYEVILSVRDEGGRLGTRRKGVVVGTLPAFAVRELMPQSDGTILVLVTIRVTADCSAIGFQEDMPKGWQLEVVDGGGSFAYPNPATKQLEALWGSQFAEGDSLTFSYRLYPGYASTLQLMSGEVSGYTADGRFVGGIGGEVGLPQ